LLYDRLKADAALKAMWLTADLFFFMDCAVSELAFKGLVSATSGLLAIKAFFTATRLLINDFFWTDMVFLLFVFFLPPETPCGWLTIASPLTRQYPYLFPPPP